MINKTKIYKSAVKNVVIVPVLAPDEVDRNWDIIDETEITKTAYEFIKNLNSKTVNLDHEDWTDLNWAEYVESYIAPIDLNFWDWDLILKWTWLVWIYLPDEIYKQAIDWAFSWISMEWYWARW